MIKNFLEKFIKKREEKKEIFLALEIDNEKVISSIWQVKEGKTEVLRVGSLEEWQEGEKESLLLACDASVSKALEGITQEPKGIIFGLPESWVKNEEILPSFKQQLRLICEKLALKPLGFVVTMEALIQYLKKEEGIPLSAILIKVQQLEVVVSLVKLGEVKGINRVGRSEDLGADVEEALARFQEKGVLPARILLFNGLVDFEEARQQLISFSWTNLNFLHLPKVEILEPRTSIKAIAIAGGSEVAKSLGFRLKTEVEEETQKPEDLGFVEGEETVEERVEKVGEVERVAKVEPEKKFIFSLISLIKQVKDWKPFRFLKRLTLILPTRSRLSIFLGVGVFLLMAFIFLVCWRGHRAAITLYLEPKIIKKSLSLRLDPEALSGQEGVIKAQREKVEVSDKRQKETSGKKLIGEKAKGEAIIYNKTDSEKVFSEETVLIGPEGLTFILKEEVKVASRSAEESGVTYGKANVGVEAVDIGTEGNLSEDTKLTIKGFPQDEFSAKTEKGFSGGTSREIRAVSHEDMAELKETLVNELKRKGQEELREKIGSGKDFFEESLEEKVTREQFSHEEDEETDSLALNLTLEVSVLTFAQGDLLLQAKGLLEEQIPEDFMLASEGIESKILEGEYEEEKGKVEVELGIKLQPKIEFEEIKKQLRGRKMQEVEQILSKIPGFQKTEVKISPSFPGLVRRIPFRKQNIQIQVKIL